MFLIAAALESENSGVDARRWQVLVDRTRKRSTFDGMMFSSSRCRLFIVPTRLFDREILQGWRAAAMRSWDFFQMTLGSLPKLRFGAGLIDVAKTECTFNDTVLASDGERTLMYRGVTSSDRLCYALTPDGLYIASSEQPLLEALGSDSAATSFNNDYLACYLAALPPPPDATIHAAIGQVTTGNRLLVRHHHLTRLAPVSPRPRSGAHRIGDLEALATLRQLIDQSVATKARNGYRVGLSLSGGLDSSALAASYARLKAPDSPEAVACSYSFPSHAIADEAARSRALAEHFNMPHHLFDAEPHLPLRGTAFEGSPDRPDASPYRAIRLAQLELLRAEGVDLCLDGSFGDDAFRFDDRRVLVDLIKSRRLDLLANYLPPGKRDAARFIARQAKGLAGLIRGSRGPSRTRWLSRVWRQQVLQIWEEQIRHWKHFPSPQLALSCFGPLAATAGANDAHHNASTGVDFAFPFFDAELLSFLLSLPNHCSYRHGQWKWALRESQRGLLPDWCRLHPKSADLTPVFLANVVARRSQWEHHDRHATLLFSDFLADDLTESTIEQMRRDRLLGLWQRVQLHRWLISRDVRQVADAL